MTRRGLLAAAACATLLSNGPAALAREQPDALIAVFVTQGDGRTDFVDPELVDSAADVRKQFRDRKGVAVVNAQLRADVIVRIQQRYQGGGRGRGRYGQDLAVVVASMTVGSFSKEFTGRHALSWRGAAGSLVDQIDAWIQVNRARIVEHRNDPPPEPPAPARGRRGRGAG